MRELIVLNNAAFSRYQKADTNHGEDSTLCYATSGKIQRYNHFYDALLLLLLPLYMFSIILLSKWRSEDRQTDKRIKHVANTTLIALFLYLEKL